MTKRVRFGAISMVILMLLMYLSNVLSFVAEAAKAIVTSIDTPKNILFMLADDMGWVDLACYGSTYHKTPNLDQLAKDGLMFTNAYAAAPYCVPSRAALQTGQYPARVFWGGSNGTQSNSIWSRVVPGKPANASTETLPKETYNIGELLGDNGYTTGHFGKWHLGSDSFAPDGQGYDVNYAGGEWGSPGSYIYPFNGPYVDDAEEGDFLTDKVTDNAIDFIENAVEQDQLFYAQVWFYAPHLPFNPLQEDIDKYKDAEKSEIHKNPAYAAIIDRLDQNVGRLIDTLKAQGVYDDTLIVFMSDNGGFADEREPVTNNYPLRSGKGTLYEGGMRVPCIMRAEGITEPGSVSEERINGIDLYPTFADFACAELNPDHKVDGESLVSVMQGGQLEREGMVFYDPLLRTDQKLSGQPGAVWVQGDYKLLMDYNHGISLYNIVEDVGEQNNIAAKHPELVKEMLDNMNACLADCNAYIPMENSLYNEDAIYPGILDYYEEADLELIRQWTFDSGIQDFTSEQHAELSAENGVLRVQETDNGINPTYPSISAPIYGEAGYKVFYMRYRSYQPGQYAVRMGSLSDPEYIYSIERDGQWHEISVLFYTQTQGPKLILSLGVNKDFWGFNEAKYGFVMDEYDRGYIEIDEIKVYDVPDLDQFAAHAVRKYVWSL